MDLFKFIPGADATVLEQGDPINGATSVMWAERYREPGEFEIIAPLSSGLFSFLPLGTIISHTNTLEAMIVENINIRDDKNADSVIQITGRSLEVVLDQRVAGANLVYPNGDGTYWFKEYILPIDNSWAQAKKMVNDHIQTPGDGSDKLQNFMCENLVTGTGTSEERAIPRMSLHQALLDILAIDNVGIKVVRRNAFGQIGSNNMTYFYLHKGVDKSASVVFSWKSGDLDTAEYFWSKRNYRTFAIVLGRYVNLKTAPLGSAIPQYARSTFVVPADDIDGHYPDRPTVGTPEFNTLVAAFRARGRQAVAAHNRMSFVRADISERSKYHYRRDYNIGDIVTVDGNFGVIQPMRVIEYVEIQDENEERGHPTLEVPNPAP